jgi:hypothetical protein
MTALAGAMRRVPPRPREGGADAGQRSLSSFGRRQTDVRWMPASHTVTLAEALRRIGVQTASRLSRPWSATPIDAVSRFGAATNDPSVAKGVVREPYQLTIPFVAKRASGVGAGGPLLRRRGTRTTERRQTSKSDPGVDSRVPCACDGSRRVEGWNRGLAQKAIDSGEVVLLTKCRPRFLPSRVGLT